MESTLLSVLFLILSPSKRDYQVLRAFLSFLRKAGHICVTKRKKKQKANKTTYKRSEKRKTETAENGEIDNVTVWRQNAPFSSTLPKRKPVTASWKQRETFASLYWQAKGNCIMSPVLIRIETDGLPRVIDGTIASASWGFFTLRGRAGLDV